MLLVSPDFTKPFEIHSAASDFQLGSVTILSNRLFKFHSRKLTPLQQDYSVGEW